VSIPSLVICTQVTVYFVAQCWYLQKDKHDGCQ